jgi:hypothetical protein
MDLVGWVDRSRLSRSVRCRDQWRSSQQRPLQGSRTQVIYRTTRNERLLFPRHSQAPTGGRRSAERAGLSTPNVLGVRVVRTSQFRVVQYVPSGASHLRGSVRAEVLAQVGQSEVDVAVANGLDELGGDETEAVLTRIVHVDVEASLDVGHLRG